MRDIYKTAKQSQMAPVRGRVKAMMAQPRAVAQARKTARQTTGFAKGGVPSMIYGTSRPGVFKAPRGREGMKRRLSLEEKLRMQKKGTIDKKTGRLHPAHEAALKSLSSKQINQMIKKGYNPKLGKPTRGALTTKQDIKKSLKESKQEAKYFKEMKAKGIKKMGGVIQKQAGGHVKKASHKWTAEQFGGGEKGKPHSTQEGRIAAGERLFKRFWDKKREEDKKRRAGPQAPARPRPKAGPPAGRPKSPGGRQGLPKPKKEDPGMYVKKGGVMKKKHKYKDPVGTQKPRHSVPREVHRLLTDRKGKPHSTREGRIAASKRAMNKHLEFLYEQGFSFAKPEPKKKGGKVDKKWIQKAVNPKHKGYCTPMTKKTCTPRRKALAKLFKRKAKKGWANGGTVVMPTVGNDVRTRAYKHGALIHPRPKPTTVAHGRGVGIAKRGW